MHFTWSRLNRKISDNQRQPKSQRNQSYLTETLLKENEGSEWWAESQWMISQNQSLIWIKYSLSMMEMLTWKMIKKTAFWIFENQSHKFLQQICLKFLKICTFRYSSEKSMLQSCRFRQNEIRLTLFREKR